MKILGISLGHDTNFSLIDGGMVKSVSEAERFYRQKRYKLHCGTLDETDVESGFQKVNTKELKEYLTNIGNSWGFKYDGVAVQNQQRPAEYNNLIALLRDLGFEFEHCANINHHLCHAASAYFTSPFSESLILSYDGAGNDGNTVFFSAKGNKIEYLNPLTIKFGGSYNNLGFIANLHADVSGSTAGKAMGLTSYGNFVERWADLLEMHIMRYEKKHPKQIVGLKSYGKAHSINWDYISQIPEVAKFISKDGSSLFNEKDVEAQDLLKTAQTVWTKCVISLIKKHIGNHKNLCVVGGCGLNGITNYEVQKSDLFSGMHMIPNPSDSGLSMGAGLYMHYSAFGNPFEGYGGYLSPYLGEEVFDKDKLPELKKKYNHKKLNDVEKELAGLICKDKIVGVVRGRYEIGPRALGNRSILCNSQNKKMRDVLNEKVKHREWYRPFAPVCTAEDAHKYFTNKNDIPYMSVICYTNDEHSENLPSVTHVDGSSRLQTVDSSQNSFLHKTLKEIEKINGYPICVNTSFNPGGEPILNYYEVALQMLKDTDLDYVLIEDILFWDKEFN
jgi:carbamoyltransferase